MKRWLWCLFIWNFAAYAGEPICAKGYITLRKGPSADQPVSWKVAKYMPFLKVDYKGSWSKVEDLDGETHWAKTADLSKQLRCVVVKTNIATLREKPGTTSPVADMRTADRYSPFKRLESERDWINIEDENGKRSWIHESQVWKPVMVQSISF